MEKSGLYVCNLCKPDRAFKVPAGDIGAAMMMQHLMDKHDISVRSTKTQRGVAEK